MNDPVQVFDGHNDTILKLVDETALAHPSFTLDERDARGSVGSISEERLHEIPEALELLLTPREAAGETCRKDRGLALQEFVEQTFEDVGEKFADEARKIQSGEADSRSIRGTTTEADEEALREEGIDFLKIALPKYDA